jgi:hypothetical protein
MLFGARDAARPWLEVRTQPLELSAGRLAAVAPLVQRLRGPEPGRSELLEQVELTGQWLGAEDPPGVTLRIRAVPEVPERVASAASPLREAKGAHGSRADRVSFAFPALALAPGTDYWLEFTPSAGAFRSTFAPLLRPRARLGARVRGEVASEPLRRLELEIMRPAADWSGLAVPLEASSGGRLRWTLASADPLGSVGAAPLQSGELQLAPAVHAALPCWFEPLPTPRAERYTLRLEFEHAARAWVGRNGPAYVGLHGRPRDGGRLDGLYRGEQLVPGCDLVLRCAGPTAPLRPSWRELAGGLALALATGGALAAVRRRASG